MLGVNITMKANEYRVLSDCVERGVNYGYRRAFKYVENPDEEAIKDAIENAVMSEICEYFGFAEDKGTGDE